MMTSEELTQTWEELGKLQYAGDLNAPIGAIAAVQGWLSRQIDDMRAKEQETLDREEKVEVGAQALFKSFCGAPWHRAGEYTQEWYRQVMRKAMEAMEDG
jgi:hypothetical protein